MLVTSLIAASTRMVRTSAAASPQASAPQSMYDFTVKAVDGSDVPLSKYKTKPVAIVVNTASQ